MGIAGRLILGRTIGQFELVERISVGSLGAVWRAVQTRLAQPVAIRELHPFLAQDDEFIRRLEREMSLASQLEHEHIVRVIEFGRQGDTYYVATELVDGPSIADLRAAPRKIPLSVAYTVACDVLAGLQHAHEQEVIHRDVNPANIILNKAGVAKLGDFSIAEAARSPSITIDRVAASRIYQSPEQFNGGEVDRRTDLYSLAVVLYVTISGKIPFPGSTVEQIRQGVLGAQVAPLHEIVDFVPDRMGEVIARAMAKAPDDRYKTAAQFRQALILAATSAEIQVNRSRLAELAETPRQPIPDGSGTRPAPDAVNSDPPLAPRGDTRPSFPDPKSTEFTVPAELEPDPEPTADPRPAPALQAAAVDESVEEDSTTFRKALYIIIPVMWLAAFVIVGLIIYQLVAK